MTQLEQRKKERRKRYRREWFQNRRAMFYLQNLTWNGMPRKYRRYATEVEREAANKQRMNKFMQAKRARFYQQGLNAAGKPRKRFASVMKKEWQKFRSTFSTVILSIEDADLVRNQITYGRMQ